MSQIKLYLSKEDCNELQNEIIEYLTVNQYEILYGDSPKINAKSVLIRTGNVNYSFSINLYINKSTWCEIYIKNKFKDYVISYSRCSKTELLASIINEITTCQISPYFRKVSTNDI